MVRLPGMPFDKPTARSECHSIGPTGSNSRTRTRTSQDAHSRSRSSQPRWKHESSRPTAPARLSWSDIWSNESTDFGVPILVPRPWCRCDPSLQRSNLSTTTSPGRPNSMPTCTSYTELTQNSTTRPGRGCSVNGDRQFSSPYPNCSRFEQLAARSRLACEGGLLPDGYEPTALCGDCSGLTRWSVWRWVTSPDTCSCDKLPNRTYCARETSPDLRSKLVKFEFSG